MIATPNSSPNPTRGGTTSRNAMIVPPSRKTVSECPIPHSTPTRAARATDRSRATIAVTATTWSASVACLSPRSAPIPKADANPIMLQT